MANLKIQIGASIAAFGLTFIARKAITKIYENETGHAPPDPNDLRDPVVPAILWAVATAALAAAIQAAVQRKAVEVEAAAIGVAAGQEVAPT